MAKKPTQQPCLWERQPNESERAWEAFLVYRNMEPPRRVSEVALKLSKSRQQISKFKAAWNWDERVAAYDNELQKEAFAKAVKDQKKMNERHIALAKKLQKTALEALDNLNTDDLTFKDIREAVKLSAELERKATSELISEYKTGLVGQGETEDEKTVIYLPENGREDK